MGLIHASAWCLDCAWETTSLNAVLLGSQHHRKTEHEVMAEQCHSKVWLRSAIAKATSPQAR